MFLVWQNTIVNEHGDIQPGAFVEIKYQESGVNVQLYADSEGTTPVNNPVQADAQGFVRVYVRNEGRTLYRIRAFRNGFERVWENELIGIGDPRTQAEISAGVIPVDVRFSEEYIRVKRYGAVANGSSANAEADTTASENALLVAAQYGGAKVVWEHGSFILNRPLVVDSNRTELIGDGARFTAAPSMPAGSALITSLGGGADAETNQPILDAVYGVGNVPVRANIAGSLEAVKIRGIRFTANAQAIKGIWITGFTRGCAIEDCNFENFEDACIVLAGSWSFSISRCNGNGRNSTGTGILLGASGYGVRGGSVAVNAIDVRANVFRNAAVGFDWQNGAGGSIQGNTWELHASDCARLFTSRGFSYTGNYHELPGAFGLRLGGESTSNAVRDAEIVGNYFNTQGDATAAIRLNTIRRCRIGPNHFSGNVSVQYHILSGLTPDQIEGCELHFTDSTSEYITNFNVIDWTRNSYFRYEPGGVTSQSEHGLSRLRAYDRVTADNRLQVSGMQLLLHSVHEAITSNQNNYAIGGASAILLSSDAARTITGFSGGISGRYLEVTNSGSNDIVLANQSASSSAANRIITGTGSDVTIAASRTAQLRYDGSASRWRIIGGNI